MSDNPAEYDPSGSMTGIVARIRATVVPLVTQRYEFWILIVVNIIFTYMHCNGMVGPDDTIPPDVMKPISALMVFGLVFYTNQCFARYFTLYATSRDMVGILHELVSEAKIRLPNVMHQRKVIHYTVAGIFAFFFEATRGELGEEEFQELQGRGLLNTTEMAFLRRYPAKTKNFICLQWSMEAAKFGLGDPGLRYLQLFTAKVYAIRRIQQDVVDTIQMPLPFQYFHIMNLLLLVNLTLLAYTLASFKHYGVALVFAFVELIFMGIREMAVCMADPFGDDEVDFPVDDWLEEILQNSVCLLESEFKVSTSDNCNMVAPLTDEKCGGMDLAFYETRRSMVDRYCSGPSLKSGFNPPHEDLRARKGETPVKASRGKLSDDPADHHGVHMPHGIKKPKFGFGRKKNEPAE